VRAGRLLASIETIVQTRGVSFMDMLITLLPIIFRAINIAPQIQQAIHTGTSTVKGRRRQRREPSALVGADR
jgi:hypothetical protein